MRSLDQRSARCVSSTRASAPPRARLSAALAASCLGLALGGCSVSYPLFGQGEGDDIKTGSIASSDTISAAPAGGSVSASPLSPPPGAQAAQRDPAAGAPAAYAPSRQGPSGGTAEAEPTLTPSDWAYARGALSIAMGAEANNAVVPWANPDSGSYGSFSASAGATVENGATCRAFSGSHSASGREQRVEGTACRTAAGYWEAVAIRTTASRTL